MKINPITATAIDRVVKVVDTPDHKEQFELSVDYTDCDGDAVCDVYFHMWLTYPDGEVDELFKLNATMNAAAAECWMDLLCDRYKIEIEHRDVPLEVRVAVLDAMRHK